MNEYNQTTTELFDLQKFAIKLGLDNISVLTDFFNKPQLNYPSIHIAGTNGKGSTAFYIAQILQTCGLKVGLFTSPHLKDFRERIRINDTLIDEKYIIGFWRESKNLVHKLKATFFDTTTLMALKYFSDQEVDIAVIETGLGGRLDSTNIIEPESVVLTPIGFDHQQQLGSDLLSIATEKAGIIKKNATVFISAQEKKVTELFLAKTNSSNKVHLLTESYQTDIIKQDIAHIQFSLNDLLTNTIYTIEAPTPATYQAENISLAFLVCRTYCKSNQIKFDTDKIISRILTINWPGRLQVIQTKPNIIFDVSHNFDGIVKSLESFSGISNPQTTDLLLGIVNDKDAQSICDYLSGKFRNIIVTEPDTERKQDGQMLTRLIKQKNQKVKFIKDLHLAYEISKMELKVEDTLIALGSHYLIGSLIIS